MRYFTAPSFVPADKLWLAEEPTEPSIDSVEIMRAIDRMSARWRELVHEYGFVRVQAMWEGGGDPDMAEMSLEMLRTQRQEAWLATDYMGDIMRRAKMRATLR